MGRSKSIYMWVFRVITILILLWLIIFVKRMSSFGEEDIFNGCLMKKSNETLLNFRTQVLNENKAEMMLEDALHSDVKYYKDTLSDCGITFIFVEGNETAYYFCQDGKVFNATLVCEGPDLLEKFLEMMRMVVKGLFGSENGGG